MAIGERNPEVVSLGYSGGDHWRGAGWLVPKDAEEQDECEHWTREALFAGRQSACEWHRTCEMDCRLCTLKIGKVRSRRW